MKRVTWLWLGALLLVFTLIHVGRFLWHVRAGRMLSQHTHKYEQHPANPTSRILIAGDSVVFGVGASDPSKSVAGVLGQTNPTADITNVGVSGAEADGLAAQFAKVRDQHFDTIMIIIGANEIVHWANLKSSTEHLDQSLVAAKAMSPNIIVMPEGNIGNAPIFPTWFAALLTRRSLQLRELYTPIADKHDAVYLDVFQERSASTWRKDVDWFYAADRFHPGDGGHADWARVLQSALNPSATGTP